jgi:ATP-binding cassette subfamily A (ABC1) protein 3
MEEADVLADRLAVVCDGKLKCVGTPLYLKNTFGDGYRVSLVCEPGNEQDIIDLMTKISPTSKLVDESGGSMVFAVPLSKSKEIGKLFSLIEETSPDQNYAGGESEGPSGSIKDPELRKLKLLLKDIGISHTTLEEVFMKVTGKKISKYVVTALDKAAAAEEGDQQHRSS